MRTFTLQQIADIIDYKHPLSRERFFYYFEHLYGFEKSRIEHYWEVFNRFPGIVHNPDFHAVLDDLLDKAGEIVRLIGLNEAVPYHVKQHTKPVRKQIYYRRAEGEELQSVEVDFNEASQVIAYAGILRQGGEIVAALDFVEKISCGQSGYMDVFDGDIFAVYEESIWCRGCEDNLYVCDKGTYRQLLYTAGKGYLRKGKPDYDMDNAYNSHVLTLCRNHTKIGNIYVDCSMLEDNPGDHVRK